MTTKLSRSQMSGLVGNDILPIKTAPDAINQAVPSQTASRPIGEKHMQPINPASAIAPDIEDKSFFVPQETIVQPVEVKRYINLTNISLDFFILVVLLYLAFMTHWLYAGLAIYAVVLLLKFEYQRILISSFVSLLLFPLFRLTDKNSLATTSLILASYFLIIGIVRYFIQRSSSKKLVYNS